MKDLMRRPPLSRRRATARPDEAALPAWLAEITRPAPVQAPWPMMIRSALAIGIPLAAGLASEHAVAGLLLSTGALLAVMTDVGGPFSARLRRVTAAALAGGAPGLIIGTLIHGRGWTAVIVITMIAGVSALLSALGGTGSVAGLQLLVYTAFGTGPLGALRPWWYPPLLFLGGASWAMALALPGWLRSPRAAEQHSVARVYWALAGKLRAAESGSGLGSFTEDRRRVTAALNEAYDRLLATRAAASGQDRRVRRLIALLNQTHQIAEASTALAVRGDRPPPEVAGAVEQLATAIEQGSPPPGIPPAWDASPAVQALADALNRAAAIVAGRPDAPPGQPLSRPGWAERLNRATAEVRAGRTFRTFAARLMTCVAAAATATEILPLARSYWVVLTVAIVLKPDFGSVFARAVQRGAGTVIGAAAGTVILAIVPYGPLLLIPFVVLAGLLPYGRSRNYGLLAVFLTPLVVLLIDLLNRTGWQLAAARLLDTLLGCGIVLLIGYAPWPASWHAHLPGRFADAATAVARYTENALSGPDADRGRLRRQAYRQLADLRTEFQRMMAEPAAVSRRAAVWWPAVVALEEAMDAVTMVAVTAGDGPPPALPSAAAELAGRLDKIAARVRSGARPPSTRPPSADMPLGPGEAAWARVSGDVPDADSAGAEDGAHEAAGGRAAEAGVADPAGPGSSPDVLRPVAEAIAGVQAVLAG